MTRADDLPELLTLKEAAELLRCSVSHVRQAARGGILKDAAVRLEPAAPHAKGQRYRTLLRRRDVLKLAGLE